MYQTEAQLEQKPIDSAKPTLRERKIEAVSRQIEECDCLWHATRTV